MRPMITIVRISSQVTSNHWPKEGRVAMLVIRGPLDPRLLRSRLKKLDLAVFWVAFPWVGATTGPSLGPCSRRVKRPMLFHVEKGMFD